MRIRAWRRILHNANRYPSSIMEAPKSVQGLIQTPTEAGVQSHPVQKRNRRRHKKLKEVNGEDVKSDESATSFPVLAQQ